MFQEIRPGAGFETGDFVKEKLGGLVRCRRTLHKEHHLAKKKTAYFRRFWVQESCHSENKIAKKRYTVLSFRKQNSQEKVYLLS